MSGRRATRQRNAEQAATQPIEFPRADPAALAAFDPRTKRCVMNCGPHRDDPRQWQERMFLCNDCWPRDPEDVTPSWQPG